MCPELSDDVHTGLPKEDKERIDHDPAASILRRLAFEDASYVAKESAENQNYKLLKIVIGYNATENDANIFAVIVI